MGPHIIPRMCHLIAVRPLHMLAVDITFLEKSSSGLENKLILKDVFMKYMLAFATRDPGSNSCKNIIT